MLKPARWHCPGLNPETSRPEEGASDSLAPYGLGGEEEEEEEEAEHHDDLLPRLDPVRSSGRRDHAICNFHTRHQSGRAPYDIL